MIYLPYQNLKSTKDMCGDHMLLAEVISTFVQCSVYLTFEHFLLLLSIEPHAVLFCKQPASG